MIRASIRLRASPEADIGLAPGDDKPPFVRFHGLNDRKFRGQKAVEGLGRKKLHPVPAPGGDVIGIAPLALVPLDRLSRAAELDDRRLEPPIIGACPVVGPPLAVHILLDPVVSPYEARASRGHFS